MTTTYQERPRKGGGTECCFDFNGDHDHTVARTKENKWRRLLSLVLSAEDAQKVHDGTKTQVRRIVKDSWQLFPLGIEAYNRDALAKAPYRVGDVLFCKEPWRAHACFDEVKPTELNQSRVIFEADGMSNGGKLRPALSMPLRFARPHRYEVIAVRCERVNEISADDAQSEGVDISSIAGIGSDHSIIKAFAVKWNSIHRAAGTRFEDGPWCFCYEFNKIN